MSLAKRDSGLVWHPYTQIQLEGLPVAITHGKGSLLWDEDGKQYLDAVSSWWVNLHGHANPIITEALKIQLEKLHHVIFAGFTHQPAVELAEKLANILPDKNSYIFYSDDGSTAVEAALKMTIQYWNNIGQKRCKIIALEDAYHGDTFGAMSVSTPGAFRAPFESLMFEVIYIPRPTAENFTAAKAKMEVALSDDEVAAFIFEPLLQGASGMNIYGADELSTLLKLCKQAGVLTIADEVFTGFGRTGKLFASEYLDTSPDIFCFSKGLTGGTMPLGVTTAPSFMFDAFRSDDRSKMLLHGHSYTANPLACVAGVASMEILLSDECLKARKMIEDSHLQFIAEIRKHPKVTEARMLGTVLALDLDAGNGKSYLNPLRDTLYKFYLHNGVILRPLGNTVYTVPPYSTDARQLQKIYSVIMQSLELV